MSPRQRPLSLSERSRLDPFVVATGDASPRDQRDLMERPFFSLAKAKRTTPIFYEAGDVRVEVFAVPEHGMATIWDADILIWAASQIVEAANLGFQTSRFLRFTPYQLLTAIGRQTGSRDYRLLKGALARLQSTVIDAGAETQELHQPGPARRQALGACRHRRRSGPQGIRLWPFELRARTDCLQPRATFQLVAPRRRQGADRPPPGPGLAGLLSTRLLLVVVLLRRLCPADLC
jgi:hypothetical protein